MINFSPAKIRDMDATIEVTLITAIWKEPRIFGGVFEIASDAGSRSCQYAFRAEANEREYHFTELRRVDGSNLKPLDGFLASASFEILGFALDGTVELLHAREMMRFSQGGGQSAEPCSLGDLGFRVRFPFSPVDPQALNALNALLD